MTERIKKRFVNCFLILQSYYRKGALVTIQNLPTLNACVNACAAICLLAGWISIKKGKPDIHKRWMVTALIFSIIFLTSYITYHYQTEFVTHYQGVGLIRVVYFLILIPHVILAIAIIPFVISAVWFAVKKDFRKHTKITRWLWPVWMYVSVTGVLVYLMLYIF